MVRRALRRARPPQSMTSGLISSFFSFSAGSFLSLGASGLAFFSSISLSRAASSLVRRKRSQASRVKNRA